MRNPKQTTWASALVLVAAAVTPADAGPDLDEGGVDAGSTPGTATIAMGMGALNSISGNLAGLGPGMEDFEDMYLINITDAVQFFATSDDAGTTFDTQMWLFRFDDLDPLMNGLGLLGNDDTSAANDASMLGPMSTDGTIVITEGLYYLAISGGAGLGVPDPGRFPVDGGLVPIFDLVDLIQLPTDILSPNTAAGVVDDWRGEGAVGSYVIHLEGVSFVPAPGAAGALALGLLAMRRRRRH